MSNNAAIRMSFVLEACSDYMHNVYAEHHCYKVKLNK